MPTVADYLIEPDLSLLAFWLTCSALALQGAIALCRAQRWGWLALGVPTCGVVWIAAAVITLRRWLTARAIHGGRQLASGRAPDVDG